MKTAKLAFLALFLSFSVAVPAYAQDPLDGLNGDGTVVAEELPPDSFFPTGKPCINQEDGQRYQCFDLEEMKELMKWEAEFRFMETAYHQMAEKVVLQEGVIFQLETKVLSLEESNQLLAEDNERIYLKWEKDNKLLLECQNKPKFGSVLAWGLAATFAATTLALGITYGVTR